MAILESLKSFFLPSAEEGAKRRLQTFGTESKGVATAAVLGSAAALIAAPAIVAAPAVRAAATSVASNLGTKFASAKLTTQAAVVGGSLIAAGAVIREPAATTKALAKAPGSLIDIGGDIAQLAANPSVEGAIALAKEHPVATAGTLTGILAGAGLAGSTLLASAAVRANTKAIVGSTTAAVTAATPQLYPSSPAGETSLVAPVTDSSVKTPIIGTSRSVSPVKRRRKAKEPQRISQSVRVNITDDRDLNDRKVFKQVRR